MKVIMLKSVKKVGSAGEAVNVKDGHAKNFLFPRKLAVPATDANIKNAESTKAQKGAQDEKELQKIQELANKLNGFELRLGIKTSKEGGVFGAVNAAKIAEELTKQGFTVDKEHVELERSIRELGEYMIPLKFPHNIEAEIKVIVEAEQ